MPRIPRSYLRDYEMKSGVKLFLGIQPTGYLAAHQATERLEIHDSRLNIFRPTPRRRPDDQPTGAIVRRLSLSPVRTRRPAIVACLLTGDASPRLLCNAAGAGRRPMIRPRTRKVWLIDFTVRGSRKGNRKFITAMVLYSGGQWPEENDSGRQPDFAFALLAPLPEV